MSEMSIDQHLGELQTDEPDHYALVIEVRKLVKAAAPDAEEKVMYGGIMFSAPVPFCGVFSYSQHVSVEFSRGYELTDPHQVLEGTGKLRRHIKIRSVSDLDTMHVRDYIEEAYEKVLPL